jgi:hypothetical protein
MGRAVGPEGSSAWIARTPSGSFGQGRQGRDRRARVELVADHDKADGHSLDEAVLRCRVGRARLDEPFLFLRTNRHDDFVRRKGRKSVADGETDVRLPGTSVDGLAGKSLGRALSDPLRMTERFLVVGEPVEHALPYDRHHDLDRLGLPDMRAHYVVGMFDGADDEDVPAHDGNVPPGGLGFHERTAGKESRVVLAASTVAIVAIAVVIVVAIVALMYILPRGGRRRR